MMGPSKSAFATLEPRGSWPCALCRVVLDMLCRTRSIGGAPRLDLSDGIFDRIEHQEGRGMACLVVAYRLEHGEIAPLAARGRPSSLQHVAHGGTDCAQLRRSRADDLASHHRARVLPAKASLNTLAIIGDDIALHGEVDRDRAAAELGVGGGRGLRCLESRRSRNSGSKLEDALAIDVFWQCHACVLSIRSTGSPCGPKSRIIYAAGSQDERPQGSKSFSASTTRPYRDQKRQPKRLRPSCVRRRKVSRIHGRNG